MASTLKSNKIIMLDKSKRFRKTIGGYGKNRKTEYNLPESNPKMLRDIRKKIKKRESITLGKSDGINFNSINRFGLYA